MQPNETPSAAANNDLARRVQLIEDKLALYQILSAFAPVIDGGGEETAADFYAQDGVYALDVPGVPPAQGRGAVLGIYQSAGHRGAVRDGVSHMLGFPHLSIDGDTARAVTYATIIRWRDEGWFFSRIAANTFEFARGADGWRITRRESRDLRSDEGKALFAQSRFDLPWID